MVTAVEDYRADILIEGERIFCQRIWMGSNNCSLYGYYSPITRR